MSNRPVSPIARVTMQPVEAVKKRAPAAVEDDVSRFQRRLRPQTDNREAQRLNTGVREPVRAVQAPGSQVAAPPPAERAQADSPETLQGEAAASWMAGLQQALAEGPQLRTPASSVRVRDAAKQGKDAMPEGSGVDSPEGGMSTNAGTAPVRGSGARRGAHATAVLHGSGASGAQRGTSVPDHEAGPPPWSADAAVQSAAQALPGAFGLFGQLGSALVPASPAEAAGHVPRTASPLSDLVSAIAERLQVAESGQEVRMRIRDDILPGVDVRIAQEDGRWAFDFTVTDAGSLGLLQNAGERITADLAKRLKHGVQVRIADRDAGHAGDSVWTTADSPDLPLVRGREPRSS